MNGTILFSLIALIIIVIACILVAYVFFNIFEKMSKRGALMLVLGMDEEDFKRIARERKITKRMSISQEIELLEKIRKERNVPQTQTNGGYSDGLHCQRPDYSL
jgi:hypothetical protein